ncbi:unnamed protein product [Prunus armeniaca]|uniref:Uncharacterized protein n=1 Tax=Prunus armeniaca TaxID=36596 RepID=A0A6J5U506_PRUAR|nr:unnamed protein product [Prunus armeniaca]
MRTRYLNIDYFTVTPIQTLETLTFLHLAHSNLSISSNSSKFRSKSNSYRSKPLSPSSSPTFFLTTSLSMLHTSRSSIRLRLLEVSVPEAMSCSFRRFDDCS